MIRKKVEAGFPKGMPSGSTSGILPEGESGPHMMQSRRIQV
jgi:hypothetical protein